MANYSIEIVTDDVDVSGLLELCKLHLRLNGSAEDTLLTLYLLTAVEQWALETRGTVIGPVTFKQHFTNWCELREVGLRRGPVQEVVSVKYIDQGGDVQTLEDWEADLTGLPAVVYLPEEDYPDVSQTTVRPITVEFVAGLADEYGALPNDVKVGLIQAASHLYANRESHTTDTLQDLPLGFGRVASKYHAGVM